LVIEIPGAGYKLLSIIMGQICAYVLTKPTTYYWDTCACHAVLNSLGGDILDLSTLEPLRYKPGHGTKECCNMGGMLAYRDTNIKDDILKIININ
jgi:inositol polyphosphate 1-phosphatase